jgi:hypothetical protein
MSMVAIKIPQSKKPLSETALQALAARLDQVSRLPCLLCGGRPVIGGVFVPCGQPTQAKGYTLCLACSRKQGTPQAVERVLLRGNQAGAN